MFMMHCHTLCYAQTTCVEHWTREVSPADSCTYTSWPGVALLALHSTSDLRCQAFRYNIKGFRDACRILHQRELSCTRLALGGVSIRQSLRTQTAGEGAR
eukprot:6068891-Amphidinium_carterae.1